MEVVWGFETPNVKTIPKRHLSGGIICQRLFRVLYQKEAALRGEGYMWVSQTIGFSRRFGESGFACILKGTLFEGCMS